MEKSQECKEGSTNKRYKGSWLRSNSAIVTLVELMMLILRYWLLSSSNYNI